MRNTLLLSLAIVLSSQTLLGQMGSRPAIPADAEHAQQALANSPRHGEWVQVPCSEQVASAAQDVKPAAKTIKTWVVYPQRKEKAPVVLVIHEIFGLTDWVRAVADQLAAEGFIAVAPDLLSGKGEGGGGTESFKGDSVREAIMRLSNEEVAQRLNAVRAYAINLPAATSKTASIGFCWGGSASFAYGTAQPGLKAAVVYYGTAPADKDALAKIQCPVLGLYGADDARVTSTVEATAKAMSELKKSFTHHEYAEAGHGFLRQQSDSSGAAARGGANLKAAQQAWAETIAFLRKHLE